MRITLIAVGRFGGGRKGNPERDLFDHYVSRISFDFVLKEVEEKRALSPDELKKKEAELLLTAIPDGAVVVALDERGKNLKSLELAKKLGNWRDDGRRDIAFLIGGANGLDGSVRDKADLVLSFGTLTWPHMLVRGMLAEQIFRCQCILANHPYHRE